MDDARLLNSVVRYTKTIRINPIFHQCFLWPKTIAGCESIITRLLKQCLLSEFKGLIPGAMGNLNVLNPFGIMRAFLSGSNPPCQEITMQTVDVNNNRSSETHYLTLTDISNMVPCSFSDPRNPLNGETCRETFKTGVAAHASPVLPEDPLAQIYF